MLRESRMGAYGGMSPYITRNNYNNYYNYLVIHVNEYSIAIFAQSRPIDKCILMYVFASEPIDNMIAYYPWSVACSVLWYEGYQNTVYGIMYDMMNNRF